MNIALEELVKEVLFRKLIDKHKPSQQYNLYNKREWKD